MSNVFFNFPLNVLSLSNDKTELINLIIDYSLTEKAISYKDVYEPDDDELYYLQNSDYNENNDLHNNLINASTFFDLKINSFSTIIRNHNRVSEYTNWYQDKYGKDSYAAIGVDLTLECKKNLFDFEKFKILCAVNSIIGKKKPFVRIVLDRIRYAMHGYRTKDIFIKCRGSKTKGLLLTDKQLKNRLDFLNSKKFFSRFTYAHRQTYYSTKIKSNEALIEAIKNYKIYKEKRKLGLEDKVGTHMIKLELEKLRLGMTDLSSNKFDSNSASIN